MSNELITSTSTSMQINPQWINQRNDLLQQSEKITVVENSQQNEVAGTVLKSISKHSNEIEKVRKELSKPIQAKLKELKKLTDTARSQLESEKDRLKDKIGEYTIQEQNRLRRIEQEKAMRLAEEQRIRDEEIEKLKKEEEEKHKDDIFFNPADSIAIKQMEAEAEAEREIAESKINLDAKTTATNTTIVESWKFEIVNQNAIPNYFMIPDMVKIRKFIQENKSMAVIPGINIYKEQNIRMK